MKTLRLLANLGYGSRKEVQRMLRHGYVTNTDGKVLGEKDDCVHDDIQVQGEPLDPPSPLTILLNKPVGYTCSSSDPEEVVYDLLPVRFELRKPKLNPVGRLDKDTSGLLILTDDGQLLHRLSHPKHSVGKLYEVELDRPLEGHEADVFASGELMLESETKPLKPAELEVTGEKTARITLHEGRYHQVRRMFAAVGNHVVSLRRIAIGGLDLPSDLEVGDWREITAAEFERIWPSAKSVSKSQE